MVLSQMNCIASYKAHLTAGSARQWLYSLEVGLESIAVSAQSYPVADLVSCQILSLQIT